MSVQVKAFQYSVMIHTLLIGMVVVLGAFFKSPPKTLVINFDLEPARLENRSKTSKSALGGNPPIKEFKAAARDHPPAKPQERAVKQPLTESQPLATPLPSEQAIPIFSQPAKSQPAAENNSALAGSNSMTGGRNVLAGGPEEGSTLGSPRGGGQGLGGGEDKGQNRYLREHFSYIRDKILSNIHYPAIARSMGWQGRVLLSFIITQDGSIKEAKIVQGSGFNILDKNAVETVKETAPFPKPPAEARLVIPITYRLE
jgi:periplasmic protein TonB